MSIIGTAPRCGGERLPFAPLEHLLRRLLVDEMAGHQLVGGSVRAQAAAVGVNPRQIHRWRQQGVSWAPADLLAVRAGFHPGDVWDDWWQRAADKEAP